MKISKNEKRILMNLWEGHQANGGDFQTALERLESLGIYPSDSQIKRIRPIFRKLEKVDSFIQFKPFELEQMLNGIYRFSPAAVLYFCWFECPERQLSSKELIHLMGEDAFFSGEIVRCLFGLDALGAISYTSTLGLDTLTIEIPA